jgi:hypothetical protein
MGRNSKKGLNPNYRHTQEWARQKRGRGFVLVQGKHGWERVKKEADSRARPSMNNTGDGSRGELPRPTVSPAVWEAELSCGRNEAGSFVFGLWCSRCKEQLAAMELGGVTDVRAAAAEGAKWSEGLRPLFLEHMEKAGCVKREVEGPRAVATAPGANDLVKALAFALRPSPRVRR